MTTLLWLRQDLRLHDQPALVSAAGEGAVIPVYVLDDDAPGAWAMGGAQRWWLHHSLAALAASLEAKGSRLILRRGDAVSQLRMVRDQTGADRIHAIRHAEPWWVEAESELGDCLCLHDGNHLAPLRSVTTGSGGQYKVYSAFWKALNVHMPPADELPVPHRLHAPEEWPESDRLADWNLLPVKPNWASGFGDDWTPARRRRCARRSASPVASVRMKAAVIAPARRPRRVSRRTSTSASYRRARSGMSYRMRISA